LSTYDTFTKDAEADKEYKHKTEVKTKVEKDQEELEVGRSKKMFVGVDEELVRVNIYFEVLKPECIDVKVRCEELMHARHDEMDALWA